MSTLKNALEHSDTGTRVIISQTSRFFVLNILVLIFPNQLYQIWLVVSF